MPPPVYMGTGANGAWLFRHDDGTVDEVDPSALPPGGYDAGTLPIPHSASAGGASTAQLPPGATSPTASPGGSYGFQLPPGAPVPPGFSTQPPTVAALPPQAPPPPARLSPEELATIHRDPATDRQRIPAEWYQQPRGRGLADATPLGGNLFQMPDGTVAVATNDAQGWRPATPADEWGIPQDMAPQPGMAGVAGEMMAAEGGMVPGSPVTALTPEQVAGAMSGGGVVMTPGGLEFTDAAPGAAPGARPGGVHPQLAQPAQPSLDELMVGRGGPSFGQVVGEAAGVAGDPLDRRLQSAQAGTDLAAQQAQIAAGGAHRQADIMGGALAERQQLEQERRQAMGAARQRYTRAMERVNAMQIEPAHFFSDAGRTVGATISVALGTIASAVSGDQSHMQNAMGLIQGAIDRDIEAQNANLQHAERGLDHERGLVDLMSQEFDDRDAALSASRAEMLDHAAAEVGALTADLGDDVARQQGEALQLQLQQDAMAARQAALAAQADREARNARLAAQARLADAQAARQEMRNARVGAGAAVQAPPEPITRNQVLVMREVQQANPDSTLEQQMAAAGVDPRHAASLGGRPLTATSGAQDQNLRMFEADLAAAEDTFATNPSGIEGDAPGSGWLDTTALAMLPMNSVARQRYSAVQGSYLRAMTGLAATDAERRQIEARIEAYNMESSLAEGLAIMRRDIEAIRYGRVPQTLAAIREQTGARIVDEEAEEPEEQ
jgi:hypothetical protein